MEVFQMAEITAEFSSICAIKNGKLASIFIDSEIRQIRLAYCYNPPKIQFTISCIFLSSNWVIFARSVQIFLPRMNNTCISFY
jgi:hypothetical protein